MTALISILLLTSLNPIKNFVSLNTYISQNAQLHCKKYDIDSLMPNIVCPNIKEKNQEAFFAYLDTIGIEHTNNNGYYFFYKKQ
jgi:hypothetical protein